MAKGLRRQRVFIVNPNIEYEEMFKVQGWDIVDDIQWADLVQFTGGHDVHPSLYGHGVHQTTGFSKARDRMDLFAVALAKHYNIPMAGICRGAQFLNVVCGGTLWQDVDGHCQGPHMCEDIIDGVKFMVSSTHHQMMEPTKEAIIIGVAYESSRRDRTSVVNITTTRFTKDKQKACNRDIEIVCYPNKSVLCFQPHPEFRGHDELAEKYFEYLNEYLDLK